MWVAINCRMPAPIAGIIAGTTLEKVRGFWKQSLYYSYSIPDLETSIFKNRDKVLLER